MKDLNEAFVHLNVGLPDDVERLKAAGYYKEAVARIDEYLAEDWTETQNSPRSQGLEMPEYEQPANPVPHGVNAGCPAGAEGDHVPSAAGILLERGTGRGPDAGPCAGFHGGGVPPAGA